MKQFVAILLLIVIFIVAITGCKQSNSTNITLFTTKGSKIVSTDTYESGKQNQGNTVNQQEFNRSGAEVFYGEWSVKKVAGYGRVYALSDEQIKKLTGKKLYFSSQQARFDNKMCATPFYKKTVLSNDEFFEQRQVDLEDLGIKKNTVTMIEVFSEEDGDYKNFWYSFGGKFLVKDKNSLIVEHEGVFFELIRTK